MQIHTTTRLDDELETEIAQIRRDLATTVENLKRNHIKEIALMKQKQWISHFLWDSWTTC
ncbi:unnamed protein product [Cyprideis torosa]|uniref:Uncharacterized protein n=1 Tax=Cyprideis torosa TaxID=163714 RepID=A0A7R8W507_9CRUS|nr:unnamed protein product [Cyprideis torosa]CAG0884769.1 unnamed protein product [Cyprideis torosa]